jgi:hypothetical protein
MQVHEIFNSITIQMTIYPIFFFFFNPLTYNLLDLSTINFHINLELINSGAFVLTQIIIFR